MFKILGSNENLSKKYVNNLNYIPNNYFWRYNVFDDTKNLYKCCTHYL